MLKLPGLPAGLTAGIVICLFFTIGFRFAGYTMPLSICLGILGGTACGLVVTWWNTEETLSEIENIASETIKNLPPKVAATELKSAPNSAKSPNRYRGSGTTLFDWLFRKK
ncbi:MAG TPA: hypothetical protein VK211_16410 [Kamptonema sp.]|nr:hypothetical protein [Kamptonema sp.]